MKENAAKISTDSILKTIQQELIARQGEKQQPYFFTLDQRKQSSKLYIFAKRIGRYLHGKGLHRLVYFVQMNLNLQKNTYTYEISDFIKFHDEAFVDNAYTILLNRPADYEGKEYYLSQLRNGSLSKVDIIVLLHFSKEGRKQNILISGAKKRYIVVQLSKAPYLGYLIKLLFTLVALPRLLKRINQLENSTADQLDKLGNNLIKFQEHINSRTEYIQEQINIKADKQEFKTYLQAVEYAKEHMQISQKSIQIIIDEVKTRLPADHLNSKELLAFVSEEQHKFDALYVEFEDRFRGTREDIKERLQVYMPYLEALPFSKEKMEVLDVGCGRAEWLEILKGNAYKAKGIDLNRVMVSISQNRGYDVSQSDVIEYLKSLKPETLSTITGFHIIEHLSFSVLMNLFEESYRVLKKGGLVIFETPNPENILVGAHYFYTDPTHINPLVPATVEFLITQSGFKQVEIKRLHRNYEYKQIDNLFIQDRVSTEMDYSVIGYKL